MAETEMQPESVSPESMRLARALLGMDGMVPPPQPGRRGGLLDKLEPNGPEPRPAGADAYDRDRALLRYGDKILIPGMSWGDVGHAAKRGLEVIGDTGAAVQATGGPPGAIVGGVMRGVSQGPAFVQRLVRGLSEKGRMKNAIDDSEVAFTRAADRIGRTDAVPPSRMDLPPIDGVPDDHLMWNKFATETIERNRAKAIDEFGTRVPTTSRAIEDQSGRLPLNESASQFQRQGEGFVRSKADPDVARAGRESEVVRRAQERAGIQAETASRAQREMPMRLRQDETVRINGALERLTESYERTVGVKGDMPGLINYVAEATQTDPWKVIRAMTDKGYDLSGLSQAAFQAPRKGGKLGPLTDENRLLWDMVRMDQDVLYRQRGAPYDPKKMADELMKPPKSEN